MDIAAIRALLDYDQATGSFTWKRGIRSLGGRKAGTRWENGYIRIRVLKRYVYAHRLAFAFLNDRWPTEVDHINGDRTDNRASNLRECTRQQNQWNAKKRGASPASPHKGVTWSKQKGKWQARLSKDYKNLHLGFFETDAAAGAAYMVAAKSVAGEFARGG